MYKHPNILNANRLIWLLVGILLLSAALFMTINAHGQWDFILPFRGKKLLLLLCVAYAIGISTLLFQTLTHNPILTPSILGFDSLYVFLQTLMIFTLSDVGYMQLNPILKFFLEIGLMLFGSLLLFRTLTKQSGSDVTRMILIGVIFGVFFRSISSLLERLIDPSSFALVQTASFAQFNVVLEPQIWLGLVVMFVSAILIWQKRYILDVISLGRTPAINLGVNYDKISLPILLYISVLVATATALVGPISFFGLLICALANALCPTMEHAKRIPIVFLVGAITLILGQTLFEHLLSMRGVLSVVIEFLGGLVFLYLILKKTK